MIREAIESVQQQDYPTVEHIIMDGGSTDGTLEILREYPHLIVVSEKDNGLYDAINKGFQRATGDFVGLLNSDDLYEPGTFHVVAKLISQAPDCDVICGGADIFETTDDAKTGAKKTLHEFSASNQISLTMKNATLGSPIPNAKFFRRSLLAKTGGFDPRYKIAADRDWLIRIALENPRAQISNRKFYRYRQHDDSLTFTLDSARIQRTCLETLEIAERWLLAKNLPKSDRCWIQRWHRKKSVLDAMLNLRALRLTDFVKSARRGMRQNVRWPFAFSVEFASALAKMPFKAFRK